MESPRVMKTLNSGLSQPSMQESSLSYISFAHKNKISLGDPSFPSYLKQGDHDRNPTDIDSEISIFDAQRYFSESNMDSSKLCKRVSPLSIRNNLELMSEPAEACDLSALSRFSSASSSASGLCGRNYRATSFHATATPTASSEASWNSQAGLLSNPPGAIAVSIRNPAVCNEKKKGSSRPSPKSWLFRRRCPCSGKKSVQVEEKSSDANKIPERSNNNSRFIKSDEKGMGMPRWPDRREVVLNANHNPHRISAENHPRSGLVELSASTGFTFPVLSQRSTVEVPPNSIDQRDSSEVFRPADESVPRKSNELQSRKLAPRPVTIADDDVASDASSDLFEIESFSTQTPSYPNPMCRRRDSLDEASAYNISARRLACTSGGLGLGSYSPMTLLIATTECYEPSEASIDWSVTTAEAFDRGSIAASEVDETTIIAHGHGVGGSSTKSKGNGFLSCRCEKAVSVGPHPVKFVPPRERQAPH